MNEDYDKWWEQKKECLSDSGIGFCANRVARIGGRLAWNYQQEKIDKLIAENINLSIQKDNLILSNMLYSKHNDELEKELSRIRRGLKRMGINTL